MECWEEMTTPKTNGKQPFTTEAIVPMVGKKTLLSFTRSWDQISNFGWKVQSGI